MLALTRILTWAGLIPFLGCLVISILGLSIGGFAPEWVFIAYSAVILSFLCGALWGKSDHTESSEDNTVLITTNFWAVIAWIILALFSVFPQMTAVFLTLLALGFVHIFWVERTGWSESSNSKYLSLRFQITSAVVLAHLVMAVWVLV